MRGVSILILILVCAGSALTLVRTKDFVSQLSLPSFTLGSLHEEDKPPTLIFGGDVLIGRRVETMMEGDTPLDPFRGVRELLASHDYSVINLEGSIPEYHEHTPDLTMRFSMDADLVTRTLLGAHIDMVSLANNHAYDYGSGAYEHARTVLNNAGIVPVGHPQNENRYSTYVKDFETTKVGFLMLHTTEGYHATATRDILEELTRVSDIQIAFVHWGTEYVRVHGKREEELAHMLVDNGVDAVIGHHPHVMQDIELYDGVPIMYSLGNLVFDQYFSDDVQTGFLVSLTIDEDMLTYTLHPYSSRIHRSQPTLLLGDEKSLILAELLNKNFFTDSERSLGSFSVPFHERNNLRISPKSL